MMPTAVNPIARPIRARRSPALGMASRMEKSGFSSSVANTQAEIMNVPSPQLSIRYSGQCSRHADQTRP